MCTRGWTYILVCIMTDLIYMACHRTAGHISLNILGLNSYTTSIRINFIVRLCFGIRNRKFES